MIGNPIVCRPYKENIGSEPFQETAMYLSHPYPSDAAMFGAKWKRGRQLTSSIGNSSWYSRKRKHSAGFPLLSQVDTGNSAGQMLQTNMSGKKPPVSKGPSLSSVRGPLNATVSPTGTLFEAALKLANSMTYQQTYMYVAIINSLELQPTMLYLEELNACVTSFGGLLELANLAEPGMKRATWHMLKIRVPNGGVGTRVNRMLLLMNFVDLSISHTCSDGWIVTQCLSKQKGLVVPFLLKEYGSLQMCLPKNGILTWMELPEWRCSVVL